MLYQFIKFSYLFKVHKNKTSLFQKRYSFQRKKIKERNYVYPPHKKKIKKIFSEHITFKLLDPEVNDVKIDCLQYAFVCIFLFINILELNRFS